MIRSEDDRVDLWHSLKGFLQHGVSPKICIDLIFTKIRILRKYTFFRFRFVLLMHPEIIFTRFGPIFFPLLRVAHILIVDREGMAFQNSNLRA